MNFSHCRTPSQSLQEYGRGIAGGLMFSLPLLFTMEVWWASFVLHPSRLLLYVVATLVMLLGYNRYAGLREDASWWECAIDSVEELGIGLVVSAGILWMIGRLDGPISTLEISAKIIMEAMTVAIGVSVGTAQLGATSDSDDEQTSGMRGDEERSHDLISQMAIALCGGVLFAANIAPTEEILVVAEESSPLKLLIISLFSMTMGGYVLFFSQFRGATHFAHREGVFQLFRGVICTYAVALVAAASTLFFFGRFDGETFEICLAQTIVLSLVASLGASAGRLLLQTGGSHE